MRTAIWAVVITLAVFYGVYAYLTIDRRSDEAKIASVIEDAAASVRSRDPGGAIACVSKNYRDGALNYDRLRMLAADALRNAPDFTLVAEASPARFDGDAATVQVRVNVREAAGGATLYDRSLTVHFAKETGRHMLLVPVKVWRVTRIENLGLAGLEML